MGTNTVPFDKERTIDWLKINQSNGFFNGFPEETMDFDTLDDEELEYYFYEWVLADEQ